MDNAKRSDDGEWSARCPAHDDGHNSLSVAEGKDGKILLNCHAGCNPKQIVAAMGLEEKDLFSDSVPRKNDPEIYRYPNGAEKLRYSNKTFSWRQPDGNGGYINNRRGIKNCLYVAGELKGLVCAVEGEKDADNLHRLGYNAVSGESGAGKGKWKAEYTKQLSGLPVVVFSDNDAVGREYAEETAAALKDVCKSVKLIDWAKVWPGMPDHADISDYIEKYGPEKTRQMVTDLINNGKEWGHTVDISFYRLSDLTEEDKLPPEFIVSEMVPVGLSFLSGAPKIRKSFMALQMAFAVAAGNPFLGFITKQCNVIYFDLEGSKSRISYRAGMMQERYPDNLLIANDIDFSLSDGLTEAIKSLHEHDPQARLFIIDTYSRARGNVRTGGANAYDADVALLKPIQRMAIEEKIAVLFVHHDKKGAGFVSDTFERLSGTMGISGSADSVLNLVTVGKRFDGKATLEYNPRDAKGGELSLVFNDRSGQWTRDETPPSDIMGNPVCAWLITNPPEPQREGLFVPYDDLFNRVYHTWASNPGDLLRKQIEPWKAELATAHNIGIQLGVKSNGKRGLRYINLL